MIYFIRPVWSNLVKIGFTVGDPMVRLRDLQTGSSQPLKLLATMPGDLTDEAILHDQFAAHRVQGEWFTMTPVLARLILLNTGLFRDVVLLDPWVLTVCGEVVAKPWPYCLEDVWGEIRNSLSDVCDAIDQQWPEFLGAEAYAICVRCAKAMLHPCAPECSCKPPQRK